MQAKRGYNGAMSDMGRIEHRLEELLGVERFDPPEAFTADALVGDDSMHEQAENDPEAFWVDPSSANAPRSGSAPA